MKTPFPRNLATIFSALLLAACGSSTSSTPPNPYDGIWVGQTAEGGRIQLEISTSRVIHFSIEIDLPTPGPSRCALRRNETPSLSAPIIDGDFTFSLPALSGTTQSGTPTSQSAFDVKGHLASNIHLDGSYGPMTITGICNPSTSKPSRGTFSADQ